MRRGTTATHTITPGIDLTAARVYLTYIQNGATVLERTNGDTGFTIGAESIVNVISQAESFLFAANAAVKAQLRWVTSAGVAGASNIFNFNVEDTLKQGEIAYDNDYSVSISGESEVTEGSTLTLTASTTPANQPLTWTSSDETVATVEDGVVTALTAGTTTITAAFTADSSVSDTKSVTVNAAS